MSKSRERAAIERNAAAQERVAGDQREHYQYLRDMGEADRAQQDAIRAEILPFARELITNPSAFMGPRSEFPTITRPDFTGQARRNYWDNIAAIDDQKHADLADADEYMRASGLERSGIRTGTAGSILAGASQARAAERRLMQDRMDAESRDAYEDTRDLSLRRHDDTRSQEALGTDLRLQGLNVVQGQQASLNPLGAHSLASANLESSGRSQAQAGQSRVQAAQLPGVWSTVASLGGAAAGAASNIWGARR